MSAAEFTRDDLSELIRIRQNQEAKPRQASIVGGGKMRTLAKPIKPLFEGKSVDEVMRRGSDHTTNSERLAELDDDEISLSSVQNMPVVPSVSESPGIFSMVANAARLRKQSSEEPHFGELPNKKKLQTRAEKGPIRTAEFQQSFGSLVADKSDARAAPQGRKRASVRRGPSTVATRNNQSLDPPSSSAKSRQNSGGWFRGGSIRDLMKPDLAKGQSLDDDDSFFEELDKGRPASMSSLPIIYNSPEEGKKDKPGLKGAQRAKEKRAQRSNAKRRSQSESSASSHSNTEDFNSLEQGAVQFAPDSLGWLPIVAPSPFSPPAANPTIDSSDHTRSSVHLRPLSKETLQAQDMAKKQQEALNAVLSQTMHSVESLDMQSVATETEKPQEWHAVTEDPLRAHFAKELTDEVESDEEEKLRAALQPVSKEAQKLQATTKKQRDQVREATSQKAYSFDMPYEVITGDGGTNTKKPSAEWHSATGDAARVHSKNVNKDRAYFDEEEKNSKTRPRARPKTQAISKKIEAAVEPSFDDSTNSILSQTNFTAKRDEGSIGTDAFAKQFSVQTAGGTATNDDQNYSKEPIHLLKKNVPIEESDNISDPDVHAEPVSSAEKYLAWQRVGPNPKHPADSLKSDTYEKRVPQKKVGPKLSDTLEKKEGKDSLDVSNHSGDSSMGESFLMEDVPYIPTSSVFTSKNHLRTVQEAPDREPDAQPLAAESMHSMPGDPLLPKSGPKKRSKKSSRQRKSNENFEWHRVSVSQPSVESQGTYADKGSKTSKDQSRAANVGTSRDRNRKEKEESLQKEQNWHSVETKKFPESKGEYPVREEDTRDAASKDQKQSEAPRIEGDKLESYCAANADDFKEAPGEWKGIDTNRRENSQLYKEEGSAKKEPEKSTKSTETSGGTSQNEGLRQSDKREKKSERDKSPNGIGDEKKNSDSGRNRPEKARESGSNKKGQPGRSRGSGSERRNDSPKRSQSRPEKERDIPREECENPESEPMTERHESQKALPEGQISEPTADEAEGPKRSQSRPKEGRDIPRGEIENPETEQMAERHESPKALSEGQISEPIADEPAGPFASRPSDLGPFAYRPPEAGPFALRPMVPGGEDDLGFASNHSTGSLDRNLTRQLSAPSSPDTTQSVDRHIVRESSHRSILRKRVVDRREALTSMLKATTKNTWSTENELLDLKRKLALSQALVQQIEVENAEVERKAVLDVARAQLALLEQRNNRERKLELRIKDLMAERNAAVLECHELRILIMGSCIVCRKRFDDKEYVMDHSIRNTILSKRKVPRSSAFEWFAGNLVSETESMKGGIAQSDTSQSKVTSNMVLKTHLADVETVSLTDTNSVLTGHVPNFTEAPLHWLSDKLFSKTSEDTAKRNPDDLPLIEEVITYQRVPLSSKEGDVILGEGQDGEEATTGGGKPAAKDEVQQGVEGNADTQVPVHSIEVAFENTSLPRRQPTTENGTDKNEKAEESIQDPWSTGKQSYQVENETASKASAVSERGTSSSRGPRSFLGSLLGERVQDEFSSLSLQERATSSNTLRPDGSKKLSLFQSLLGERVDEDAAFARIGPSLAAVPGAKRHGQQLTDNYTQKTPRKFGARLKGEQVLDDMEIFNSLLSAPDGKSQAPKNSTPTPSSALAGPKKRILFGLRDEKFDGDDHDDRILMAMKDRSENVSQSDSVKGSGRKGLFTLTDEKVDDDKLDDKILLAPPGISTLLQNNSGSGEKRKGLLGLGNEKFDGDDHDAQILNLLKESIEAPSSKLDATKGPQQSDSVAKATNRSRDRPKGERAEEDMTFFDRSPSERIARPGLSPSPSIASPFAVHEASPRKRASTNRGRRGSTGVSYLGRFSSADRLPGLTDDDIPGPAPLLEDDAEQEGASGKDDDKNQASSKQANRRSSVAIDMPVDVELLGDRPWRNDTGGKKPSITLPRMDFVDESAHSSGWSKTMEKSEHSVGDFDHVAALLEQESADWKN